MSVLEARVMLAELFAALRELVEAGYTAGVIIYFILNIVVILYIHYKNNDESWLYKD